LGFDDDCDAEPLVSVSEPVSEVVGGQNTRRIPRLLDNNIPMEERDRPRPRKTANRNVDGEISLFSLNENGSNLTSSTATFIKGVLD
jgi:hypothetical protein